MAAESTDIAEAAAVPFHRRLSFKLTAVVAAITLATLSVLAAALLSEERRQMTEESLRGAALFSETIRSSTHDQMLRDQKGEAYAVMNRIGGLSGVEKVRIFNKEGRITFSTASGETGTAVDKKAEACFACHAAGRPLERLTVPSRARVYRAQDGHRMLGMVTAIDNELACSEADCHVHPESQRVLGVVDVVLSLRENDARLARGARRFLFLSGLAVVILVLLIELAASRLVVARVVEMAAAARRIGRRDFTAEVPVRSRDEVGVLAASFNEMRESLARARAERQALLDDLERKVEERTADLKAAQRQLVETEKLASLGQLSASIAHEINNPLAGILTFSKLLLRNLDTAPVAEATRTTALKNLRLIARETERCRVIVRNLLDFARGKAPEVKDVAIGDVVDEALSLTAHKLELAGIALEKDVEPSARLVADFGQLRQAVVNLVLNACDAMPDGGTLRLSARRDDGHVTVTVADTGVGIPEENLARVFDPFFTTKDMGTGLGLPVVKGVVEKHGGTLEVSSEPGRGTVVTLTLRAAERPAA